MRAAARGARAPLTPADDEGARGVIRWRLLLLCAALVVVVFAAYGRVAGNQFTDYDDPVYITDNAHVRSGLTLETAAWALRTGANSNWHPLTWLSHALDVSLFGLDPAGHHFVSVALHAANSVLLLLALFWMSGALWRSAVVAALFALHPLHVESVAWAAERKDVLSTLFWMLALLVYARHAARPTAATRWAVPALLGLGLLAKPMLVTLPFVLLLLDFWPLRRFGGEADPRNRRLMPPAALLREKLPLFALAAASCVVTWIAQQRGGAVLALDSIPLGARLANASVAYLTYLVRMFWPMRLGALYPLSVSIPAWQVLGSLAALAGISAGAVALARRAPYLVTGWFWYLGALVPVIGLVQVGVQATADRYTYIPSIGVFVMLAWGLPDMLRDRRAARTTLTAATALILAACALLTWRQVGYWRDSLILFRRTAEVTSDNYINDNNLGAALLRLGRFDEARPYFEESLRLRPNRPQTLSNLGLIARARGLPAEAIDLFRQAVKINPAHFEAWYNLGDALEGAGDLDGAIAAFREAQRLRPEDAVAGVRLRAALEKKDHPSPPGAPSVAPEARVSFDRGNQLRDQGRLDEAVASYRETLRLAPNFAEAHNNLGSALARQGEQEEAVREFSRAVELAPGFAAAHNNLGVALAMRGDAENAARQFREVLHLDPRDETAHYNLGVLLAQRSQFDEAIAHFEEVLRLKPDYADARRALEQARARRARAPAP